MLRGSLLLDGSTLQAGERADVAAGRAFELRSAPGGEAHFVCELKAGQNPASLAAAAERALKLAEEPRAFGFR